MDCRAARLLFDFDRPGIPELDEGESDALHDHLAHCPECDTQARAERRLDAYLGRAVRQVEVPARLRGSLLDRLAAERRAYSHRWTGRALRVAAVAAALLAAAWGWWYWHATRLPGLDLPGAVEEANHSRRGPEEVQAAFARLGVDTAVPEYLEYAYLIEYGITELPGHPGKKVPFLVFARADRHARVYIVSARQFDLRSLGEPPANRSDEYRLEVRRPEGAPYAYLIFYTGESTDWLNAPRSVARATAPFPLDNPGGVFAS